MTGNRIFYICIAFLLLSGIVYVKDYYRKEYLETNDEYKLIQEYLLNDSPLYGLNRPKLWIHTKYEINARMWQSFQSRNTTDLNQPFIHLTIKTIVDHCSKDFNICLIDDDTFEKLLPDWDVRLSTIAEPLRHRIRQLGLLKLVYYYGGMVVPNSFVCRKNLAPLFHNSSQELDADRLPVPFVFEQINTSENRIVDPKHSRFLPDITMFGSKKNSPAIKTCIEYVSGLTLSNGHVSGEAEFVGMIPLFLQNLCNDKKVILVDGTKNGVKTNRRQEAVLLDRLMEEEYVDLSDDNYGVYVDDDALLSRIHYQWFAVMSKAEIYTCQCALAKYIMSALVDAKDVKTSILQNQRSVVSI